LEKSRRRAILCDTIAMSDPQMFFHLRTKTMHPCYETKNSHAESVRNILCPGCAHPKPDVTAVNVCLQERSPRDKPLNFLFGPGIGLIHRELIDLIGEDIVRRDLYLGRVTDCDDKLVADWMTFRGRQGIIVRGSKEAECRACKRCGRNLYYAAGRRYLYPAPSPDATIFESHLFGLVVPASVHERVATKRWRMLGVDKLPVVDEPVDGLGVLPFFAAQS
jgi:hypothetical protein